VKDLDAELDTPYFNNHPKEKAALKLKLANLSGSAFSLRQLLYVWTTRLCKRRRASAVSPPAPARRTC